MEHFGAGRSPAPHDAEPGDAPRVGDPAEDGPADDPLGDEAAFPSTWQQVACGEFPGD